MMNIEKQLEDIRDQLNILAAAMEIRGAAEIPLEVRNRAYTLQKNAIYKFKQKELKKEAFKKYMDLKYQILELETDNPEFKEKTHEN
jgi:hypothetical protein